ncbi:MAG: protein kinase domain-containing protein [Nitrososphaerota archaeon]
MAGNVIAGPDAGPGVPLSGMQLARRYALSDEMTPGALCRIFRGDDLTLRRPVVVKAIPPAQIEVYTEALRATSAQTHPAAVALYDALHQDGWLFLVQEAIAGQALSRYLRQGIPSERATNLALQLARALTYTHHREMVHGDLTPTAVLVDRQATVRINNFGLPPDLDYFLDEGGDRVQALIAEGTPYSDVLALGLLLRQMLSSADLPRTEQGTRQLRDDVPPELARIVARCATSEVDDAITEAAALTVALEGIAEGRANARTHSAPETPGVLRAVRAAEAEQALWSGEQTVAGAQPPRYTLERGTHEVGSRFAMNTDPGHSDGATTRPSDGADLAMPPRLRLPTRPLPDPAMYQGNANVSARARPDNDGESAHGIMLGGVLILGLVLFAIFFLIGYLGPFTLGGH